MRRLGYIFIGLLCCVSLSAQLRWPAELNRLHTINPAFITQQSERHYSVYYNEQLSSIDGGPMQYQMHVVLPFSNQKTGMGLQLGADTEGPYRNFYSQIAYAYGVPIGVDKKDKLSIGLAASFANAMLDATHFVRQESADLLIDNIPDNGQWQASARVGFEYRTGLSTDVESPIQFFIGSSFLRIIQSGLNFGAFDFRSLYQWMLHLGVGFSVNENFDINLMALHNDFDYEKISSIRVRTMWQDKAWVQLQYGTDKAIMTAIGLELRPFANKNLGLRLEASRYWFGSSTIAIFRDNQAIQLSLVQELAQP